VFQAKGDAVEDDDEDVEALQAASTAMHKSVSALLQLELQSVR
jgi:hypothetical protein